MSRPDTKTCLHVPCYDEGPRCGEDPPPGEVVKLVQRFAEVTCESCKLEVAAARAIKQPGVIRHLQFA